MIELKPCPFCGGKANIGYGRIASHEAIVTITALCCNCHIGIFKYRSKENEWNTFQTEEEAIEAWNRRADNVDT